MTDLSKFQIGQSYFIPDEDVTLRIEGRNCNELRVVRCSSHPTDKDESYATAHLSTNDDGAYEYFDYHGMRVTSGNIATIEKRLRIKKKFN